MNRLDSLFEQFKVHGKDLSSKIKDLIHEGNVRRIIVKDEHGHTFMEIPLTVATVGVIAAPVVAAVATIAGMVANFTLVVERYPEGYRPGKTEAPRSTDPSVGATEDQVDLADTVSTDANDRAGTGKPDAQGG
ncbi:MAG TPA: DUF4342 domain-containing protein [Bryobacteraceae bacterium]|jgi:hypothetical protein|nr:DUF4342 domain-containing protein [Bryobacteraceae bacterium]